MLADPFKRPESMTTVAPTNRWQKYIVNLEAAHQADRALIERLRGDLAEERIGDTTQQTYIGQLRALIEAKDAEIADLRNLADEYIARSALSEPAVEEEP